MTRTLIPFTDAEYASRAALVRARMSERGFDVLLVTSPANVAWLTGYEAVWYPPRLPVGVALVAGSPTVTFFDWVRHEDYAREEGRFDELVLFDYDAYVDPVRAGIGGLVARGGSTVGLERSAMNPNGSVLDAVARALMADGHVVADGSWIVDGARGLKSAAELERMAAASSMIDAAFNRLTEVLRPGLTELQVAATLQSFLADEGSEVPAHSALVSSGPTAWRDTHAFPSRRALEVGDVVTVDGCGVVDRYHVNLCRAFSIGVPNTRAAALIDIGTESLAILRANARAGDGPEVSMAMADAHVRSHVPAEQIWWLGGYALGLSLPPGWVGHTYLANDGPERIAWADGYTSNYEAILVDRTAGYEVGVIDTIVMAGGQVEVLSAIPRDLIVTTA